VNDALSIGAGLDYQHIKGELSQDQGGAIGVADIQGTDNAWGYNLGALYNVNPTTRIGVAYRSAISYTLNGTVTTSLPFANGPVTLDIKLPDSWSFSGFHQFSDKWDVMADVSWTGWSTFKQVKIVDATGATISNTPENWKDTVRVAVGVTHHYNRQWLARAGLAYDQAPVPDAFRHRAHPGQQPHLAGVWWSVQTIGSQRDRSWLCTFIHKRLHDQSAHARPRFGRNIQEQGGYFQRAIYLQFLIILEKAVSHREHRRSQRRNKWLP